MPFDDFDLQVQCEEYYNEEPLEVYLAEERAMFDSKLLSDETHVDASFLPDDWSQES